MAHKSYFKKPKLELTNEKTCKVCSKRFKPFKTTQVVCSIKCSVKVAKKVIREEKKANRDMVVKYSVLMSEAKKQFQKWIRKRDENKPCVSCGKLYAEQWDGSHYYKAEVFKGVIFDEDNVHKSCSYCNKWLDGNLNPYRIELFKRIGIDRVNNLDNKANTTRQKKWSRDELIEIREKYRELNKTK